MLAFPTLNYHRRFIRFSPDLLEYQRFPLSSRGTNGFFFTHFTMYIYLYLIHWSQLVLQWCRHWLLLAWINWSFVAQSPIFGLLWCRKTFIWFDLQSTAMHSHARQISHVCTTNDSLYCLLDTWSFGIFSYLFGIDFRNACKYSEWHL